MLFLLKLIETSHTRVTYSPMVHHSTVTSDLPRVTSSGFCLIIEVDLTTNRQSITIEFIILRLTLYIRI